MKVLTGMRAIVACLIIAIATGAAGIKMAFYFDVPPMTYSFPSEMFIGTPDPGLARNVANRTITRNVGAGGLPVVSLMSAWPISGLRCGPATATEVTMEFRLVGQTSTDRIGPSLFGGPIEAGEEQGVNSEGSPACMLYSAELLPGEFVPEVEEFVERRGRVEVRISVSDHMAVDGTTAPATLTSEPFLLQLDDPVAGSTSEVSVTLPGIDESTILAGLDPADTHSRQMFIQRAGLALVGLALLSLLWVPFAAVLPLRESSRKFDRLYREELRARRSTGHILSVTHHALNREIVMLGLITDDLSEAAVSTEDLDDVLRHLEWGRDTIATLAMLGSGREVPTEQGIVAEDLTIFADTDDELTGETVAPLERVNRLLIQTLIRSLLSQLRSQARARQIKIIVTPNSIRLEGSVPPITVDAIDRSLAARDDDTMLIRRILRRHNADLTIDLISESLIVVEAKFPDRRVGRPTIDLNSETITIDGVPV